MKNKLINENIEIENKNLSNNQNHPEIENLLSLNYDQCCEYLKINMEMLKVIIS